MSLFLQPMIVFAGMVADTKYILRPVLTHFFLPTHLFEMLVNKLATSFSTAGKVKKFEIIFNA
jgi:hypothetical protein